MEERTYSPSKTKKESFEIKDATEPEEKSKNKKPAYSYPEGFEMRYPTVKSRKSVKVYADFQKTKELFQETENGLKTKNPSPLAIRAMIEVAKHRDWSRVMVRGTDDFKRAVFLEARTRGINVDGYTPKEYAQQINKKKSYPAEKDKKNLISRRIIESVIERDLRKSFPDQPEKVREGMGYAQRILEVRMERGERIPSLKIRDSKENLQIIEPNRKKNLERMR